MDLGQPIADTAKALNVCVTPSMLLDYGAAMDRYSAHFPFVKFTKKLVPLLFLLLLLVLVINFLF